MVLAFLIFRIIALLALGLSATAWIQPPPGQRQIANCVPSSSSALFSKATDVDHSGIDNLDDDLENDSSFDIFTTSPPTPKVQDRNAHVQMLNDSLEKHTGGKGLLEFMNATHEWDDVHLNSRWVLMSHSATNTLNGPMLNYANFGACGVFEISRDALLQLPAIAVAEPGWDQDEWALALQKVKDVIPNYSGWRCTLSDQRRFYVRDAVVWNCYDSNNSFAGQAILFDREKISYADER